MSDAINRARDIIERYLPAMPDQQAAFVTRDAARALDAAGLLVTPERDETLVAEVERLRSAADSLIEKALKRGAEGQVPAVNVVEISKAFDLERKETR